MNRCKCSLCGWEHDCIEGCGWHPEQERPFCICVNCEKKLDFEEASSLRRIISKVQRMIENKRNKTMNKTQWNNLFFKKVWKPAIYVAVIPFGLAALVGLILADHHLALAIELLIGAALWCIGVLIIYALPSGFDFVNKYGGEPRK